jgi:hypothetical protein
MLPRAPAGNPKLRGQGGEGLADIFPLDSRNAF